MKKIFLVVAIICLLQLRSIAQNVSINPTGATAHPSAILDVNATDKGMLIPRMETVLRESIASPATGLLVFDTDVNNFFFFDGVGWKSLSLPAPAPVNFQYYASTSQAVNGNTDTKINFGTQGFANNTTITNSIFTVPTTGVYHFSVYLSVYGNNPGTMNVSILSNGVEKTFASFNILNAVFQQIGFSNNIQLTAGDQVTIHAFSNATMAITVGKSSFFTGFKTN